MKATTIFVIASVLCAEIIGQGSAQTTRPNAEAKHPDGKSAVSTSSGITRDQADEIIKQLKAIHTILENQQIASNQLQPALGNDKVEMNVKPGWYSLGRDDAPVTVVEFADYQCSFCRMFHSETFAELKKNYIDTGKVRFVSRDLPLDFHPNAPGSAQAARCAGEQREFWEMRDMMLTGQSNLSHDMLLEYAKKINLDMLAFGTCLNENKYKAAIQQDISDANALGIHGTPAFVVGKTSTDQIKGVRIAGAAPYSVFDNAIKSQLSSTP